MTTRLQTCRALCILAAIAAASLPSAAKFANPTQKLPADRMIQNAEAWIKEKPADAQGYYVLARVHAMAWAYGPEITLIKPADDKSLPSFAAFQEVQVQREDKPPTKEDLGHLSAAITAYENAITHDPKNALYNLGLASTLQEAATRVGAAMIDRIMATREIQMSDADKKKYEQAAQDLASETAAVREAASAILRDGLPASWFALSSRIKDKDEEVQARITAITKGYWDLKALAAYRKAYELALPTDLKAPGRGLGANSQVSGEAAQAILDILKTQPQAAKPNEVAEVTASLKQLPGMRAITPILFAMPGSPLPEKVADLLDPANHVSFDLAGDDVPRTWPWLKPGTALLVWDPSLSGHITSGRQLFGSRTWWIFFRNGYEALSLLDNNRDGKLSGTELQGIALWIDKNADAISQPGEVLSLPQANITEIATSPDSPNTLSAHRGITFSNGTSTPTFDWITEPVTQTSEPRP